MKKQIIIITIGLCLYLGLFLLIKNDRANKKVTKVYSLQVRCETVKSIGSCSSNNMCDVVYKNGQMDKVESPKVDAMVCKTQEI